MLRFMWGKSHPFKSLRLLGGRMNFKITGTFALLAFAALTAGVDSALAAPSGKVVSVAQIARKVIRSQRQLDRRLAGLTPDQINGVMALLSTTEDADADGLPDILESDDGMCDSDSDDDGVQDGDEYEHGTDPDDSDSDDDGHDDNDENEVKGLITAISVSEISAGGSSFMLNNETAYMGRNKQALTNADFLVGECVEIEGHLEGATLVADKVKEENRCD